MKLRFDENVSEKLCDLVNDIFPDAKHVRHAGFQGASDSEIWDYASFNEYAILSKDSDFMERAIIAHQAIQVIWNRLGNCSTANIHLLIRNKKAAIDDFFESDDIVLELP